MKYYGTRKPGGAKHGVVRTIVSGNWIQEATWYEDKQHGLSFYWFIGHYPNEAFKA